jgi:hypothetical protein
VAHETKVNFNILQDCAALSYIWVMTRFYKKLIDGIEINDKCSLFIDVLRIQEIEIPSFIYWGRNMIATYQGK